MFTPFVSPVGRALGRLVLALGVASLGACANLSQVPEVDLAKAPAQIAYPQAQPAVLQAQAVPTGSLFAASSFRPGFEDHRARLVGDTLRVVISEKLEASQESTSNVKRNTKLNAKVTNLPFLGASLTDKLQAGVSTDNSMTDAGGDTEAINEFKGDITATVTEVLPNGHLVVVGEKQIGVNQNVDVLQFSGTVDPRNIRAGNSVVSTQVANVRVLSRGRGAQADAQTFGWLSRFFLTLLPF